MITLSRTKFRVLVLVCLSSAIGPLATSADEPTRAVRLVVPPARVMAPAPSPVLGTFYPNPVLLYAGDVDSRTPWSSPLYQFGAETLPLVGPMSPLRTTAAPVLTYSRGYDGTYRPSVGVSFSYPNLPSLSPIVYPTQSNVFGGPRVFTSPPMWQSGAAWIDQN